jgi:hypothetical protein
MRRNYYMINMQKLLFVVQELHGRGYEKLHVVPSLSPTGLAWRCSFVSESDRTTGLIVSTWISQFSIDNKDIEYSIDELTNLFEEEHSNFLQSCRGKSIEYTDWYKNMLKLLDEDELPYAFADYFSPTNYWRTSKGKNVQTLPDEKHFYYSY